jgi:hypothetical protein
LYSLIGIPLIKSIALAWNAPSEPLVATVFAALVLVLVAGNLLAMWRVSGPVMGTLALAICWVFIGSMPMVDRAGWGGISLQWAAKLVIGLAVVAALLSLRQRVQQFVRTALPYEQTWSDGLVNIGYLIVSFPIIAVPVRNLLEPAIGATVTAVAITVIGVALVIVAVDVLRRAQGIALAIVGLFVCAPTLLGLPLWESGAVGSGLQWLVRFLIGVGILALLIGLRGSARRSARTLLVPLLDRQISALYAPRTEADAEARWRLLERIAEGLVDLLYVLCAFVAVVLPMVSVLSESGMTWLITVVYVAFVAIAGWLLYRVWRNAGAAGFAVA